MRNLLDRHASNSIKYTIGILLIAANLAEIAHAAPIETSLQRSIGQALESRSGGTLKLPARSDGSLVEAIKPTTLPDGYLALRHKSCARMNPAIPSRSCSLRAT